MLCRRVPPNLSGGSNSDPRHAIKESVIARHIKIGVIGAGRVGRKISGEMALLGCSVFTWDADVPHIAQTIKEDMRALMLDDSIINEAIGRVVVISKLMDICSKGCCMLVIATLNDDHVKQAVVERIIPDIPTDTLVLICMPDAGNTNFINSLVVNIGSQAARVMGLGVWPPIICSDKIDLTTGSATEVSFVHTASDLFTSMGKTVQLNGVTLPTETPPQREITAPAPSAPSSECVICLERAREMVFIPCGHRCTCTECCKNVKTCPMCRVTIASYIKVFDV